MSNEREAEDYHFGHDLEAGLLARAREWIDLFPWLRLLRVFRAAGSPPLVLLVALTFAIWWPVVRFMIASANGEAASPVWESPEQQPVLAEQIAWPPLDWLFPSALLEVLRAWWHDRSWLSAVATAWTLLAWSPAVLLLVRQGALLTAGRPMVGFRAGLRAVWGKLPAAALVLVIPVACVSALAFMMVAVAAMARFVEGIGVLETILLIPILLIALPCGILGFGGIFAVPLAFAAITNEEDQDALDALSRGYEYSLRRPWMLGIYVLLALLLTGFAGTLGAGVSLAAQVMASQAIGLASGPSSLAERVVATLACVPLVLMLTLFWSLVGGIYLLLRFDAGGQEVEDLAVPKVTLSELPQRASAANAS